MKKLLYGVAALAFASVALASTSLPYLTEKVAEFVIDKLDVTTLPSAIRPKHEKAKKTFSDYGYVTRQLDEKEAIIETTPNGQQIDIRVLQQEPAGIYVCVAGSEKNANKEHIQRVLFLKLKDVNGLLKSKESIREFTGCPAIGGADNDSAANSY
jgi:hypothetical protein